MEINRKVLDSPPSADLDPPRPPADVAVRFLDWTDYCARRTASPLATPAPRRLSPISDPDHAGIASSSSSSSSSPTPASAYSDSGTGGPVGGPRNSRSAADGCDGIHGTCGSAVVAAAAAAAEAAATAAVAVAETTVGVETGEAEGGTGDTLGTPEVVLAADVVYDVKYHPALVGVVVETLRRCPDALVVFASTVSGRGRGGVP